MLWRPCNLSTINISSRKRVLLFADELIVQPLSSPTNQGSLTMGFAGANPRQLVPTVGTKQVGNAISAVLPSSTLDNSKTLARSNLFESLGFAAHLRALKPVFMDLQSGVDLIFREYRIYINHW